MDVVLSLWTLTRTCCQFSVGEVDVVLVDRSLHYPEVVAADLVTVPSATRMNQNKNLSFLMDPEMFRNTLVKDPVSPLDLNEMIPTTQATQLRSSTRLCAVRNLGRISSLHTTLLLDRLRILRPSIAMVYCPIKTISNRTIQFCDTEFDLSSTSQSGRYEVENRVYKLRENWANLFLGKICPNQPNSAVRDDETISDEVVSIRRSRKIIHILIKVNHFLNAHNLVPHRPRLPQPLGSGH